MSTRGKRAVLVLLAAGAFVVAPAPTWGLPIDFEALTDLEAATTQFAGDHVTFANAVALASGADPFFGSLNELEFPPHSGGVVVADDGGPMLLTFDVPFASVEGFFNYSALLTLMAFGDPAGTMLLGTVSSLFSSNLALSGDPGSSPNEFLQIAGVGPIRSLQISGDPTGGSFTLDDFNGAPVSVPAPTTLLLLAGGLLAMLGCEQLWPRRVPPSRTLHARIDGFGQGRVN